MSEKITSARPLTTSIAISSDVSGPVALLSAFTIPHETYGTKSAAAGSRLCSWRNAWRR